VKRRGAARQRSRQLALQVLYAADLAARPGREAPSIEATFESIAEHFELSAAARDFAAVLTRGVAATRDELDELISRHATHWRISRMAAVDRNVLRLAAWELSHTDTPTPIVLDEAIELARRFGSDESPGFVNGVLHALARSVRGGERREREARGPGA
jgi:N utilization substance protein B